MSTPFPVHPGWHRIATPPPAAFHELLIWHRNRTGLSQLSVAKRAGLNVKTIRYAELGESEPTMRLLVKLVDFYDLTAEEQRELVVAAGNAVRTEPTREEQRP